MVPEHGSVFRRPDGWWQGSSAPCPRDFGHRLSSAPAAHLPARPPAAGKPGSGHAAAGPQWATRCGRIVRCNCRARRPYQPFGTRQPVRPKDHEHLRDGGSAVVKRAELLFRAGFLGPAMPADGAMRPQGSYCDWAGGSAPAPKWHTAGYPPVRDPRFRWLPAGRRHARRPRPRGDGHPHAPALTRPRSPPRASRPSDRAVRF